MPKQGARVNAVMWPENRVMAYHCNLCVQFKTILFDSTPVILIFSFSVE